MIVQLEFKEDEEELKRLWHITQATSQHLGKEYTIADICMSIILAYLKERYVVVKDGETAQ